MDMPRPASSLYEEDQKPQFRNCPRSTASSTTKVTYDTLSRKRCPPASTVTTQTKDSIAAREINSLSKQLSRTTNKTKMQTEPVTPAAKRKFKPEAKTSKGSTKDKATKTTKGGSTWWTPLTYQSLYTTTSQFGLRRQATTFTELEKLTGQVKRALQARVVSSGQPSAAPRHIKLHFNLSAKPQIQSFQSEQKLVHGKVNPQGGGKRKISSSNFQS